MTKAEVPPVGEARVSFPNHDPNWTQAADFLAEHAREDEPMIAPDLFWRRFPNIYRYVNTSLNPRQTYDWVVAHKGEIGQFSHAFLRNLPDFRPVYANPVFVVLTRREDLEACDAGDDDVEALWNNMDRALAEPQKAPLPAERDVVLPDRGQIELMKNLDDKAFVAAMDRFWAAGGYVYDTVRDRAYYKELDSLIDEYLGDAEGLEVLDLCCGTGRLKDLLKGAKRIDGVDISKVAIEKAGERNVGQDRMSFKVMDAHKLKFADASKDLVLFIDAIEHVHRAEAVFDEAVRVLRPGGRLMVTVASRDSLHEFMNRKLGFGEFETNYQHIREFGYDETIEMTSARGLKVVREDGIFLYPYWGIPGVDQVVREITDNDEETVELFRQLGRKVGPRHAYAFVLLLEKAA